MRSHRNDTICLSLLIHACVFCSFWSRRNAAQNELSCFISLQIAHTLHTPSWALTGDLGRTSRLPSLPFSFYGIIFNGRGWLGQGRDTRKHAIGFLWPLLFLRTRLPSFCVRSKFWLTGAVGSRGAHATLPQS